eukprot:m.7242 g.7242  ORF g.7242 m.7242 type:complete len:269 (+) comp18093_c0_seq1:14-820(+)
MSGETIYDEPDFGLRKKAPPQPEDDEIMKDGYLQKAGRIFKGWKRRWFILTKDRLLYYKNEASNRSSGEINLQQITVVSTSNASSLGAAFQIKTKSRTFTLAASSEDVRREWMVAVERSMKGNSLQSKWHIRLSAYGTLDDPSPYGSSGGTTPTTPQYVKAERELSFSPPPVTQEGEYAVVGEKKKVPTVSVASAPVPQEYAQVNKRSPAALKKVQRLPSAFKGTCDEELRHVLTELGETDFSTKEPFDIVHAEEAFKKLGDFLETLD